MSIVKELLLAVVFMTLFVSVPAIAQTPQQDLVKSALLKLALNKDMDGAIADCTAAIKIDPKYETAYKARANIQYQKGDYAGTVADFTTLIGLSPNVVEYFSGRGDAYVKLGQPKLAIADYDAAVKLDPAGDGSARIYLNRGLVKFDTKDTEGAIADYSRAIAINPDYLFAAYEARAAAYRSLGKTALAEADDKSAAAAKQKTLDLLK